MIWSSSKLINTYKIFVFFPTTFLRHPIFSISVCRDVEGNKMETVGNLTFRSCNMLTVLWVFPPFRNSCSKLSSSTSRCAIHIQKTPLGIANVIYSSIKNRFQQVINFHGVKGLFHFTFFQNTKLNRISSI